MLHALGRLVRFYNAQKTRRSIIHRSNALFHVTSYSHLSDNLESTTSSEDDGSGQAGNLLVVLGVDVGEHSVLALIETVRICLQNKD